MVNIGSNFLEFHGARAYLIIQGQSALSTSTSMAYLTLINNYNSRTDRR